LISFEQYSNDIGKIILHSLMGLLFGLMTAFIGHRLIFGIDLTYLIIYPALFFSDNKELKSTPLSNKNNNTATSVLKISVINSGIKNFFCIDR
jgi:hypothetical protein